jgi:hypothetical protein
MSKLVLLVVAAAWAAVLLPPLLRSRLENRPGTSISSFRRQLSSLQRSGPGGMSPQMRSMARPLVGPGTRQGYSPGYQAQQAQHGQLRRPVAVMDPSMRLAHRGMSQRALVKQRRQNVLMILVMSVLAFGFLSFATSAEFARYGLVLAVCLLAGYVYVLVQYRRTEVARSGREYWPHAA